MYNAYQNHRRRSRSSSPGGTQRLYPTFRTNAGQIIPPLDVSSSTDPIFNNENLRWAGKEVTQLRRSGEQSYYIRKLETNKYISSFFVKCLF